VRWCFMALLRSASQRNSGHTRERRWQALTEAPLRSNNPRMNKLDWPRDDPRSYLVNRVRSTESPIF
jgi:hypothetical protein